jgi:hypothetical protein
VTTLPPILTAASLVFLTNCQELYHAIQHSVFAFTAIQSRVLRLEQRAHYFARTECLDNAKQEQDCQFLQPYP